MKYLKPFGNFNSLNESVNENYVVKPYETDSNKVPSQSEVNEFEDYLDAEVENSNSYGNESTFNDIIENLLVRSIEEMLKNKTEDKLKEDKIKEVVEKFMSDFSTDSEFERDTAAHRGGYEDSSSGSYSGTTDFKGQKVFSWSSDGDGYDFGGSTDNVDMLYKAIKDYLTMLI